MKILDWIKVNRVGHIFDYEDRFEIEHQSGEYSILFKNIAVDVFLIELPECLTDIYTNFDGADLFSSTFKIAALNSPKNIEGINLVDSLSEFKVWCEKLNPRFPEATIPFMYQAGIGIYAVGKESGKIYEWDEELEAISDEFDSLEQIFTEWLEAIE
ncbi:TPA: SMI1/KNR4 family protein [Photobacterium damselae]